MEVTVPGVGVAEDPKPASCPDSVSPFMGDWTGLWLSGEEKYPDIAALVIAMGNTTYQVVLVPCTRPW